MNKSNEPGSYVFDIKDKIATGSFGSSIFKAYDASLGQVAIAKKFPTNSNNNNPIFEKVLDEVKLINSPHIVRLYGYYKASKNFWIVMEYCHGHSIYDMMERLGRPLSEKQIRTALLHTLRGLEHLHNRGIVHTRVKACNILVTTAGICKLSEPSLPVKFTDVDMSGVLGNSYWTAPEVLQEEPYTTSCDIWSLGITIIEMVERQPPYADTHPSRVMVTIPKRPPPQPLNPTDWNKYLKIVLTSCLQKYPGHRDTATELLANKYIKKAEMKGLQTLVQKSMKVAQGVRLINPPKSAWTPQIEREENDETNWTESGTLVWAPPSLNRNSSMPETRSSKALVTNKLSAPANITTDLSVRGIQTSDSSDSFAECESDTMKPSTFAKYKVVNAGINRKISNSKNIPNQDASVPHALLSKSSEKIKTEIQQSTYDPKQKKISNSIPGAKSQDRLKKSSSDEPHNIQTIPRQSNPIPTSPIRSPHPDTDLNQSPRSKRKKKTTPSLEQIKKSEPLYDTSTVTLNMVSDYIPSYMDIYKDSTPPLMEEETRPSPCDSLMRRNSIDRRGIELERMQEEMRQELDKVDYGYCKELEELKVRYMTTFEMIKQVMSERNKKADGKLEFYDKLKKSELCLMLGFIKKRHQDRVNATKEHFDLQHKFLMDAYKKAKNVDEGVQFNLKISENNEEKTHSISEWERLFQQENQAILKAMEKIDYAGAIANE